MNSKKISNNYLKRLSSVICEYSKSKNFKDAVLEWEYHTDIDLGIKQDFDCLCLRPFCNCISDKINEYGYYYGSCSCSYNRLRYIYYIINNNNNFILSVGSCCIKKFMKENGELIKDINEKLKMKHLENCLREQIPINNISIMGYCDNDKMYIKKRYKDLERINNLLNKKFLKVDRTGRPYFLFEKIKDKDYPEYLYKKMKLNLIVKQNAYGVFIASEIEQPPQ